MTDPRGGRPAESGELHFTRAGKVTLPVEEPMMLNPGDWARVRRNVGRLGEPLTDKATTWSSTAFGAFITCVAALVTFHATPDNDPESVVVGFAVGGVAALAFAVCFYLIGRTERDRHSVTVGNACEDMDDIARRVGRSDLIPPKPEPERRRPLRRRLRPAPEQRAGGQEAAP